MVSIAKAPGSGGSGVGIRGGSRQQRDNNNSVVCTPRRGGNAVVMSRALQARLFLVLACIWPLMILALFACSSPGVNRENTKHQVSIMSKEEALIQKSTTRLLKFMKGEGLTTLRNVLDRVDIMGYGPSHPRIGVVIVGDDQDKVTKSIESIFRYTDMDRILLICVVMDGHSEDAEFVSNLENIARGSVPHWHGLRPDLHLPGNNNNNNNDDDDDHGHKIHVMFHETRQGMAASRLYAAMFLEVLVKHHEKAGLKSPMEDILLVFLQQGAALASKKWLPSITNALIIPPPIFGNNNNIQASFDDPFKVANAISFPTEGPGKRTSFDASFAPIISDPTASELNLSSGQSYPTPAWNGVAIAMRLETFLQLPAQDTSLVEPWHADLELSLNLWLCGDGMDILSDMQEMIVAFDSPIINPLPPRVMARFAAAWMENVAADAIYHAYTEHVHKHLTHLEWETFVSKAKHDAEHFPKDLPERCRSFMWYVQNVNPDLSGILQELQEQKESDEQEREQQIKQRRLERPKEEEKVQEEKEVEEQDLNDIVAKQDSHHELPQEDNDDAIPALGHELRKPSKPLCQECLEIVQQAKPIDISFVDVSNDHKDHPHLGAKDENGNLGYIHDETALHDHPPGFTWDDASLREACTKRDNHYKMLKEKVVVDLKAHKDAQKSGRRRDKIFCLIYTIEKSHDKIPAIRETWGPKCDGFMVGSTKTDRSIGAVEIPHEGPEEYNNIWQKVRSMWSYIYDNYYEKYDWFHIGGDDLFLIVENLRLYLESDEIKTAANGGIYLPNGDETTQVPLFLGRRFAYMGDMNNIFNSGGAGYTMNKAAFKLLVTEGFKNYFPHAVTFSEDTMVAKIFKKMGVLPYETKDEHGGERYMPFMPGHHYGYRLPPDPSKDWYAKYSINIKFGLDHCSAQSVAFHYVKGDAMKRLYALLYHQCPADTM